MLAHLITGERGRNWMELAADPVRRMGLEIPHVQVAGSAVEKEDDAGVRLRPDPSRLAPRSRFEQSRQGDAEQTQTADLEKMPPADSAINTVQRLQHQPLRSCFTLPHLSSCIP